MLILLEVLTIFKEKSIITAKYATTNTNDKVNILINYILENFVKKYEILDGISEKNASLSYFFTS